MRDFDPAIRDPKRIAIDDARERERWCLLLKVDEATLRDAVARVGPMSALVAVHLATRRRHA